MIIVFIQQESINETFTWQPSWKWCFQQQWIFIGYNMHTSFFFFAFHFCQFCMIIHFFHPCHNGQWPSTSKVFFLFMTIVIMCMQMWLHTLFWAILFPGLFVLPSLIRSLNSQLICTLNFSMKFNQWVINSCKFILKLNNIFSKKVWLQLFHSFKLYFLFWKFRILH